jgi:hypothetical protein
VRSSLIVLGGAVGLLLLIACTNTASLIVGRNIQREREFAVRTALGSSARRLAVQLVVENLVLYGISGCLGLLIAFGSVRGFLAWNPFRALPAQPVKVSVPVLAVAAMLTVLSGLAFGAYPAFRTTRFNLNQALRSSTSSASAARGKLRSRSVIALTQISLSVILLIGASLMLTTFLHLNAQPLGFNPADTHVIQLSLPYKRYGSDIQLTQFADRLSDRLRALPGVDSAGMTYFLRLSDAGTEPSRSTAEGILRRTFASGSPCNSRTRLFSRYGYCQDFRSRLLKLRCCGDASCGPFQRRSGPIVLPGQEPDWRTSADRRPERPSHAEESLARSGWRCGEHEIDLLQPDRMGSAPGSLYGLSPAADSPVLCEHGLHNHVLCRAHAVRRGAEWCHHSTGRVGEDPNLPVGAIKSLGEMVAGLQTQPRVRARLLSIFAGLALLLAAIGIYGVMAQSVAQRYREIGIRMALGADRRKVLLLVLKQGFSLTFAGVLLGAVLGLIAVRFMKSLLYGITSSSPATYLGVMAIVSFVALVASFIPARRAASIDPVRSLRTE